MSNQQSAAGIGAGPRPPISTWFHHHRQAAQVAQRGQGSRVRQRDVGADPNLGDVRVLHGGAQVRLGGDVDPRVAVLGAMKLVGAGGEPVRAALLGVRRREPVMVRGDGDEQGGQERQSGRHRGRRGRGFASAKAVGDCCSARPRQPVRALCTRAFSKGEGVALCSPCSDCVDRC